MSNASACDFTPQQVCDVRLFTHNLAATAHYCALTNILRKISFGGELSKSVELEEIGFNLSLPIKCFTVTPRVHRKPPACDPAPTRMQTYFNVLYVCLFQVGLRRHITASSHRTVYLADLKHSWNKPHQGKSGQGLCGTTAGHVKPPEPQCRLSSLHVHVYVQVCVPVCES